MRPEQQVRRKAATGELVDLRAGVAELDDPANGVDWGGARVVRAELLAELLTGAGRRAGGSQLRAVRLRGARISGTLDLEAARLVCPLLLHDCYFEQPINLVEAEAPVLRLPGCHVPGLSAYQMETRGNLEMTHGFTAPKINLVGAHIGGRLDLDGAALSNPGGIALNGVGLTVDKDMSCGDGFTAKVLFRD